MPDRSREGILNLCDIVVKCVKFICLNYNVNLDHIHKYSIDTYAL